MLDPDAAALGRKYRAPALGGAALAAALAVSVPVWAQTSEDLNAAELNRLTTAAPARSPAPAAPMQYAAPAQLAAPAAPPPPSPGTYIAPAGQLAAPPVAAPQPGSPNSAYIDCRNPYYAQYCQAYAAWLNQYYAGSNYGYPYGYGYGYDYGYPDYYPADIGFGFFGGRFNNFHHGGGFRGGSFRGGGFHGGGGRGRR
jgi:hypothetical protein